ncbi:MAG: methylmalonyl Co-A mutase-associated GTPase MeaB [Chloroflexi bacterium]|nr:methylmalonyl Co-A mutase-associated GTPase MeaB [Chloroflexota bacterium]
MSEIAERLLAGEQRALSRLITLLERGDPAAAEAMKVVDGHTGRAYTVGITGPPGSGKSTIVDQLTQLVRQTGSKVSIIAVDPTSPFTGGAILGDRIRMQRHYLDPGVFIRSVATRGQAGGLPRIVKSMARALDAAGTDLILVETVGVGQTELGIVSVADTVLVTLNPESGDAIQTLKAGVMEIADVYVVNKADRDGANQMASAITGMLHLSAVSPEWSPPVMLTAAHTGQGIEDLWMKIQDHREFLTASGGLENRREARRKREFLEAVEEALAQRLRDKVGNDSDLNNTLEEVARKEIDPYSAALEYLDSSLFSTDWLNSR